MRYTKSSISIKVEYQILQTYFCPGQYDANTSQNHISSPLRLNPENMLNQGSYSGSCPVPLLLPLREFAIAGTFSLKMLSVLHLQPLD